MKFQSVQMGQDDPSSQVSTKTSDADHTHYVLNQCTKGDQKRTFREKMAKETGDRGGWRERKGGEGLTPVFFGTTHKCLSPSCRKRIAALARDMVSTTVYGDVFVIGWRSTYISISSCVMTRSSNLSPFPDPGLAKSNA